MTPTPLDTAAAADAFAAPLGTRLAASREHAMQGMPSDGDSRGGYLAMGQAGWIGLHWPARFGCQGLTMLHTAAAEERFGYHWLPLSGYLLSVKTIGNAVLRFASEELQERVLPGIASGELAFCQGFSEPGAGSDLAALRTRAAWHGDRYVVRGQKTWTSSAQLADWIYLAVRTGPGGGRQHGISVLVAPMSTPGISVRTFPTLGGGVLADVFLDDVEIPAANLVGTEHHGWDVLLGTLDYERVTSEKVGILLRVLDDLEPLAPDAMWRMRLAGLRGEAAAARAHGMRAAGLLAAGQPARVEASMAKLAIATLAQRVARDALEMLGPAALVEGPAAGALAGRVAALIRAVPGATIAGGTAEIQRLVIARERVLAP